MGNAGGTSTRDDDDARLIAQVAAELGQPGYEPILAGRDEAREWLAMTRQQFWNYTSRYEHVRHGDQFDVRAISMYYLRGKTRHRQSLAP